MRTCHPDVYIPAPRRLRQRTVARHRAHQAMKDENPKLVTVSRGYREPTCFDTTKHVSR
jgi:hypothetical protein